MTSRPIVRYHGGKWILAPWIIEHMPRHRVYTETFGGAASVLLRKERSYAEVYNDLDGEIVNLFTQARDNGPALRDNLFYTPYARQEFTLAYEPSDDPLEQARRTVVRSFMGFGSNAAMGRATGFRANSNRSGNTPAHDWKNYAECFEAITERLRGVVIENRPALQVMAAHDSAETLHYVDPPYVLTTRQDARNDYKYELDESGHTDLAEFLRTLKGAVMVSGYRCDLYDSLFEGWHRVDRAALADGSAKRTESLWISANHIPARLF